METKRRDVSRLSAPLLVVLFAGWLLWPALNSQHLEGYTANLEAIALMANRGAWMQQDLLLPPLTEFLYYTRPAMIGALRLIAALVGPGAVDFGFRILMVAAVVGSLAGSVRVARSISGVSGWASLLALLLIPGAVEPGFFFNDNLPSAALAIGALVLVARDPVWWRMFLAGAVFGLAMLIRVDAVLLAPALIGLVWLRRSGWRPLLHATIAAVGGGLAALVLGQLLLGATPLDAFIVATGVFAPTSQLGTRLFRSALFLGVPGMLVVATGMVAFLRDWRFDAQGVRRILVLVVYPALILLIALGKVSSEIRYVYPLLLPFLALHGGLGVETLARAWRDWPARLAIGAIAVTVLAPPLVHVADGPSILIGEAWMPLAWDRWQRGVSGNLAAADDIVAVAGRSPMLVVIDTHFNAEAFTKERLIAAGYAVVSAPTAFPGCDGFSVYRRDGHTVAQLRTIDNYALGRTTQRRYAALVLATALSCRPLLAADRALLTVEGTDLRASLNRVLPAAVFAPVLDLVEPADRLGYRFTPTAILNTPWSHLQPDADATVPPRLRLGALRAFPLSRAQLVALRATGQRYLASPLAPDIADIDRHVSWPQLHRELAARCRAPEAPDPAFLAPRCFAAR